jgi:hypothetical protein
MPSSPFEFHYVSPSIVRCEDLEFAIEYEDAQGEILFSGFDRGHPSGGLLYFPTVEEWDLVFPRRRGQRETIRRRLIEYVLLTPLLNPIGASLSDPELFAAWPKELAYLRGKVIHTPTAKEIHLQIPASVTSHSPADEPELHALGRFVNGLLVVLLLGILVFFVVQTPPDWLAHRFSGLLNQKLTTAEIYAFEGSRQKPDTIAYVSTDKSRVRVVPGANFAGLQCEALNATGQPAGILLVSNSALEAMGNTSSRPFPVNTVIFKLVEPWSAGGSRIVAMRKREPGYAPEQGDWAYLIGVTYRPFESGRIDRCAECHAKAANSDFVFNVASEKIDAPWQ